MLKRWILSPDHIDCPYASEAELAALATDAGVPVADVTAWLASARKRIWIPQRNQVEGSEEERAALREALLNTSTGSSGASAGVGASGTSDGLGGSASGSGSGSPPLPVSPDSLQSLVTELESEKKRLLTRLGVVERRLKRACVALDVPPSAGPEAPVAAEVAGSS